jgi:hypothetical protein
MLAAASLGFFWPAVEFFRTLNLFSKHTAPGHPCHKVRIATLRGSALWAAWLPRVEDLAHRALRQVGETRAPLRGSVLAGMAAGSRVVHGSCGSSPAPAPTDPNDGVIATKTPSVDHYETRGSLN